MPTNKEWLYSLDPHALTEWFESEHGESHESRENYSERIYGVPVSDCPYCGCERVVIHDYSDMYERPHSYRVEHMDERESFNEGCFESYFAFNSVEDAVMHADMRNGYDVPEHVSQDEAAHQSNVSENSSDAFTDSREKLEAEIREWTDSGGLFPKYRHKLIIEWLDRQAAITERECIDQRIADQIGAMWESQKIAEMQAQVVELQAENDALLAAHADDVERLDAMGEGELQAQVDELTADRDRYRDLCIRAVEAGEKFATLVDMNGEVLS